VTRPPGSDRRAERASAVAVSDGADGGRPRIVAKGQGALAEQILAIAFANDVKVREDADLVELLEAIDVDCEIPLTALAAVAEILTFVYRANGGGARRPPEPASGQQPTFQEIER